MLCCESCGGSGDVVRGGVMSGVLIGRKSQKRVILIIIITITTVIEG